MTVRRGLYAAVALVIIAGLLFVFWSGGLNNRKTRDGSKCAISLVQNGQFVATITPEIISSVPSRKLELPNVDKPQKGPSLRELLQKVGISEFESVKAFGYVKKRIATAEYTLNKSKLHEKVLLSYSKRGTVKLVVPELNFDEWIVDIYRLEIK